MAAANRHSVSSSAPVSLSGQHMIVSPSMQRIGGRMPYAVLTCLVIVSLVFTAIVTSHLGGRHDDARELVFQAPTTHSFESELTGTFNTRCPVDMAMPIVIDEGTSIPGYDQTMISLAGDGKLSVVCESDETEIATNVLSANALSFPGLLQVTYRSASGGGATQAIVSLSRGEVFEFGEPATGGNQANFTPDGSWLLAPSLALPEHWTLTDLQSFRSFDVTAALQVDAADVSRSVMSVDTSGTRVGVVVTHGESSTRRASVAILDSTDGLWTRLDGPTDFDNSTVVRLAFSPDGRRIAVHYQLIDGGDSTIEIYDANTGKGIVSSGTFSSSDLSLVWVQAGEKIAYSTTDGMMVMAVPSGEISMLVSTSPEESLRDITWARDDRHLVANVVHEASGSDIPASAVWVDLDQERAFRRAGASVVNTGPSTEPLFAVVTIEPRDTGIGFQMVVRDPVNGQAVGGPVGLPWDFDPHNPDIIGSQLYASESAIWVAVSADRVIEAGPIGTNVGVGVFSLPVSIPMEDGAPLVFVSGPLFAIGTLGESDKAVLCSPIDSRIPVIEIRVKTESGQSVRGIVEPVD